MSTFSVAELKKAIEEMTIYEKDYEVLFMLLSSADRTAVVKIIEEVAAGNLMWTDVEKILSTTNYPEMLSKVTDVQMKIKEKSDLLWDHRTKNLYSFLSDFEVRPDYISISNRSLPTVNEEANKLRDKILFDAIKPSAEDSELTTIIKTRIYNALRNGQLLLSIESGNDLNYKAVSDREIADKDGKTILYTVSDDKLTVYDSSSLAEYPVLSADDILLYFNSYSIPLKEEDQILDEYDLSFMRENPEVDETLMKKIKISSILYRIGR